MKNTLKRILRKILVIVLVLGLGFSIQHFFRPNLQTQDKAIDKAELVVGGYSAERNLTAEDKRVFDQALQSGAGVAYTPLKVSTQIVAGTNYKFYTKLAMPSAKEYHYYAYVYIFKPLGEGKATVSKIEPIV